MITPEDEARRAGIASGALRGDALLRRLRAVPYLERDAWIDRLLGFDPPPPDVDDLPRGAVPYLPCGVDEVVAMVEEAPLGPDDAFVDLGSGVGRVAILAHLLSGATARGVEIQAPLVDLAIARAAALDLPRVSFVHADAAEADLEGSVFFLYSPFNGATLPVVLGRLEAVARTRPIVVASVGVEFRDVPWLRARTTSNVALALYDSRVAR